MGTNRETLSKNKPAAVSLPEPMPLFSPRPVSELDAAAIKLQRVYKDYRNRRNLADCAVVVEELWEKALAFAALKQSSVSFFNIEEPETAVSRWERARTRAAKLGKGWCEDEKAQMLAPLYCLEAIDPRHRFGLNLQLYYDVWFDCETIQPFFYWLDVGDGKDIDLKDCPRTVLSRQCIKYLGPREREAYQVIVENGKLVHRQTGKLVHTVEGSKWIFVLSTSKALYVGEKIKGVFQHSSFVSGGATTAAGRLVAHNGVLEAIWPSNGHYLPTIHSFKKLISFLEEQQVDLTNVKMCAIDDDKASFNGDTSNDPVDPTDHQHGSMGSKSNATNREAPVHDLSRRLFCKWSTGSGPRIGCVRDYPTELGLRSLEQVNLSPKLKQGCQCHGSSGQNPIPSPRPSPSIRLTPGLAYMGLPSPKDT